MSHLQVPEGREEGFVPNLPRGSSRGVFGEGKNQYLQGASKIFRTPRSVSASTQVPACDLHPVGTSILPEFLSIIIPVGVKGDEAESGNVGAAPKWGKQT